MNTLQRQIELMQSLLEHMQTISICLDQTSEEYRTMLNRLENQGLVTEAVERFISFVDQTQISINSSQDVLKVCQKTLNHQIDKAIELRNQIQN